VASRLLSFRSMRWAALFCAISITTACGPMEEGEDFDNVEQAAEESNGIRINGIRINGIRINGIRINGIRINGIRINGISLQGGGLVAIDSNGQIVSGKSLVNGKLSATLSDGTDITLKIDDATQGTGSNSDIWWYKFSAYEAKRWVPLCDPDPAKPGDQLPALFARGTWNETTAEWSDGGYLSLSCSNGAVAKCTDAGYKPWALGETTYPSHLQACIRMIRADYCGTGQTFTTDGRSIDIWDDLGIQAQSMPGWTFEAEWTPDGARCVASTRLPQQYIPPCLQQRMNVNNCGDGFGQGVLLMNSFMPAWTPVPDTGNNEWQLL
jgi:hypothetical protein